MGTKILSLVICTGMLSALFAASENEAANEKQIRRYVEGFVNNGNAAVADEVLSPNFVRYGPSSVLIRGPEEMKSWLGRHRVMVPDFHVEIQQIDTRGDSAWVVGRYSGTYSVNGDSAAGKRRVEGAATSFFRFADGKIVEHHLGLDLMNVFRQRGDEPQPFPSEQNRRLVNRITTEMFNKGNLNVADELYADGHTFHGPRSAADDPRGPEGAKRRIGRLRAAFSDLEMCTDVIIGEGPYVAARGTLRGTHTGTFLGVPPTHRKIVVNGLNFHRIENGKIAETWVEWDAGELMRQLGANQRPVASRADQAGNP